MKKSERLQVIVDLQAQQEKKALESLARMQQQCTAARAQLKNLTDYRQEYLNKYKTGEQQRSSGVAQLLEFRAFIHKLDQAVSAQEQTVEQKQSELDRCRKTWEQSHQKTQSIQKICTREATAETNLADKREQQEQDERAMRSASRGGTGSA